jgi:hypothetical protein
MVLYLCVLIVFSLHQESLKLILVDEPLPEMVLSQLWFLSEEDLQLDTDESSSPI